MKRGDTKAGMKANIRYFIKWSALALVIGSVAGAAGTIFPWEFPGPPVFGCPIRPCCFFFRCPVFDRLDVPLLP